MFFDRAQLYVSAVLLGLVEIVVLLVRNAR